MEDPVTAAEVAVLDSENNGIVCTKLKLLPHETYSNQELITRTMSPYAFLVRLECQQ